MTEQPRFDDARSAAIRQTLIEQVEQTPARDHRRRVRIAVAAVLAALGVAFGGAAVAVAVTGGAVFGTDAGSPPTTPTTTAVAPSESPTPTPTSTDGAPTPLPLVVTSDSIAPHAVIAAPSTSPIWTVELPGETDMCRLGQVLDVADGYALVQRGPTHPPEDSQYECDLSHSHYSLTLVDTVTGAIVWDREWEWEFDNSSNATAQLLGTSGRALVWPGPWSSLHEGMPDEVLDLVTGETLGPVSMPGFAPATLHPLTGPSGDVTFTAQKVGADGAPTGEWVAGRANPLSLDQPVWLRDVPGVDAGTPAIVNSSSVMEVDYTTPDSGNRMLDVLDVGTGVPMAEGVTGRRYQYLDDITLRLTDFDAHVRPRSVAGIDDEGNEVWSRTSPSPDQGFQIADISGLGTRAETGLREHTDLLLLGPDLAIEAIDQSTGQTLWTADGSACSQTNFPEGVRLSPYFVVTSDGLLMQQTDGERVPCAFDRETGAAVDVSSRPSIDWWTSEPPVVYQLMGGLGTGGLYSVNGQPFQDSGPDGVATAIDAVSGETLWTLPIGYDEVWRYAGGRLVGIAGGTVSGIG